MAAINSAACKQADAFRLMPDAGSASSNHCLPSGFAEQTLGASGINTAPSDEL